MKLKRKTKLPRNGSAIAARARHAGPMKDKRSKRSKEPEDFSEEIASFACPECGLENFETDTACPNCKEE